MFVNFYYIHFFAAAAVQWTKHIPCVCVDFYICGCVAIATTHHVRICVCLAHEDDTK
jgi:hypothetical protein